MKIQRVNFKRLLYFYMGGLRMDMYHIAYEHHILIMAVWTFVWVAIILGLFFLIRSFMSKKGPEQRRAIEILDERYARGEIKKEEYMERKKDILG